MCQVSVRVHNGGSSSSCSWSQVSDNKINSNPNFTSVCPLRSLVGSLSHFTSIYPVWERVRFRSRTDQSLPRPGVLRLQGPALLGGQMAGDCENLLVTRDSVLGGFPGKCYVVKASINKRFVICHGLLLTYRQKYKISPMSPTGRDVFTPDMKLCTLYTAFTLHIAPKLWQHILENWRVVSMTAFYWSLF